MWRNLLRSSDTKENELTTEDPQNIGIDQDGGNLVSHCTFRKSPREILENPVVQASYPFEEHHGVTSEKSWLDSLDPSFLPHKKATDLQRDFGFNEWLQYPANRSDTLNVRFSPTETNAALISSVPAGAGFFPQTFGIDHRSCLLGALLTEQCGKFASNGIWQPPGMEAKPQLHTNHVDMQNQALASSLLMQSLEKSITWHSNDIDQKFPIPDVISPTNLNNASKPMLAGAEYGGPSKCKDHVDFPFHTSEVNKDQDILHGEIEDCSESRSGCDERPTTSCCRVPGDDSQQKLAQNTFDVAPSVTFKRKCCQKPVNQRLAHKRHVDKRDTTKPKRGLTAYNFFFKDERERMLKEKRDGKHIVKTVGFRTMARIVSEKWQALDSESLSKYKAMANADAKRYKDEMKVYKARQREELSKLQLSLLASVNERTKQKYFNGSHAASSS